jgi:hypothetical protein
MLNPFYLFTFDCGDGSQFGVHMDNWLMHKASMAEAKLSQMLKQLSPLMWTDGEAAPFCRYEPPNVHVFSFLSIQRNYLCDQSAAVDLRIA